MKSPFARRRAAFLDEMAKAGTDAVAILPAAPVFVRNNDVEHDYRQDSDLHYLTGFDEPLSALVLGVADRRATLFCRPRDPEREIWDGPRAGVDGAKQDFGMDEALVWSELGAQLPGLLENKRRVYYRIGRDRAFDDRVLAALEQVRARARRGVTCPTQIVDPGQIVHELRLRKTDEELASMRRAGEITGEAHARVMAAARPGMAEFELEAVLLDTFRRRGAERSAYSAIVGSGPNACILHYRAGNRRLEDGELCLIDAGCEYEYYASDVTRTFPVSGKFSREQQAIYELVLEAQLASIAATRPGATLEDVHAVSVDVVTRGLVKLGLLAGDVPRLVADEAYKPFFMHRTGHWLGMDVHDVGAYFAAGAARKLEPGFVTTVEPGIYIAKDYDKVGPEWRGIGVRIEDDVLVGADGPVNLTAGIPKTVAEVERACAG